MSGFEGWDRSVRGGKCCRSVQGFTMKPHTGMPEGHNDLGKRYWSFHNLYRFRAIRVLREQVLASPVLGARPPVVRSRPVRARAFEREGL